MQEQRPNPQHPSQPQAPRVAPPTSALPRAAAATTSAPNHGPARITAPPVMQTKALDLDPIELEDEEPAPAATPAPAPRPGGVASAAAAPSQTQAPSKIRQFATSIGNLSHQEQFKRTTTVDGRGAVRVRSFHGRLSDEGIVYMDSKINEWLDTHPDIEVKFATTTVGLYDGKIKEPALIVNVWY
jgi:hypothetical protein